MWDTYIAYLDSGRNRGGRRSSTIACSYYPAATIWYDLLDSFLSQLNLCNILNNRRIVSLLNSLFINIPRYNRTIATSQAMAQEVFRAVYFLTAVLGVLLLAAIICELSCKWQYTSTYHSLIMFSLDKYQSNFVFQRIQSLYIKLSYLCFSQSMDLSIVSFLISIAAYMRLLYSSFSTEIVVIGFFYVLFQVLEGKWSKSIA